MAGSPATQVPLKMNTGATMPQLGFGTWQAPVGEVGAAVEVAIKNGFRHIDGALIYRNEEEVGNAIAKCIAEGVVKREDLFITTKLWNVNHDPAQVRAACEHSLKRLQLDYLDLYLIHWPVAFPNGQKDHNDLAVEVLLPKNSNGGIDNQDIPMPATWKAMEELVDAKLVRAIGISNCSVEIAQAVIESARIKPAAHQIECHPSLPQRELRALHAQHGILTQAYCPLGIGMQDASKSLLNHPGVKAIADAAGLKPAELLLRWNVTEGNITLSKSVTPERIAQNAATTADPLPAELVQKLNEFGAANPLRVCNPNFFRPASGDQPFFTDGLPGSF